MGKVNIYLKLVDGVLEYRDSESQHGKTIITSVDPGDTVIWKLDKCSGISEITNVKINGTAKFFSEGPDKKDFDEWRADVGKKSTGQITYEISYMNCLTGKIITEQLKTVVPPQTDPPVVIINP